jgi:uncharacterized membrane protein
VEAAKTIDLKLRIKRLVPDWKNDITIQSLAFPGNFKMQNETITGEQTEATVRITVQQNTRPGKYTLAVLGQSQVPFNKDPSATERPNTLVSLPSQPITITVIAPPESK